MDLCKWIGIAVIVIQAFSLFLAIVLRALISIPRINHDMEGDYDVIGRTSEPLLDPRLSQTSGLAEGDARGGHSDIWSLRMREKYHLDGEARQHIPNQSPIMRIVRNTENVGSHVENLATCLSMKPCSVTVYHKF